MKETPERMRLAWACGARCRLRGSGGTPGRRGVSAGPGRLGEDQGYRKTAEEGPLGRSDAGAVGSLDVGQGCLGFASASCGTLGTAPRFGIADIPSVRCRPWASLDAADDVP